MAGYSTTSIVAVGLGGSSDDEVLAFARKGKYVVLTHDKDFGNLIRYPLKSHHGVVMLRLRNQKPSNVLLYLFAFLKKFKKSLKNRLVIVRENGVRIV